LDDALGANWALIKANLGQIGIFHRQNSFKWLVAGALQQSLLQVESVHAFQVDSQTNQAPFPRRAGKSTQGELAEAQHFFDDPEYWIHRAFAQAINYLTNFGL
jgi:hypothetical protein